MLVLVGWPVALLLVGLPLVGGLALLGSGGRRLLAGALAVAIPAVLVAGVPNSAPFVLAAVFTFAAAMGHLRRGRLGYAELSLCALVGVALAGTLWAAVDPDLFGRVRAALESAGLEQARLWTGLAERYGLGPREQLALQEVLATSAEASARTWPSAAFLMIWVGAAAGWAFAARRSSSPAARRVAVAERCSRFRAPDAWLWALVAAVLAYLFTPEPGPRAAPAPVALHEAGLNLALVAAGVFAWQGLAVVLYLLERKAVRPLARVLLVAAGVLLFPLPLFVLALALGLAEAWLDVRSRANATGADADGSP